MNLDLLDGRDIQLLTQAIIDAIEKLKESRETIRLYGCSTMTIQDAIERYQRMLREI